MSDKNKVQQNCEDFNKALPHPILVETKPTYEGWGTRKNFDEETIRIMGQMFSDMTEENGKYSRDLSVDPIGVKSEILEH